jgi:Tfp pilus assembly protein PilF
MKKLFSVISVLFLTVQLLAQDPDAAQLHETAKQFMRGGDWANAVLILNKALAKEPNNLSIQKDLALTYYYQRDFAKAKETVKPLADREDADVQTYQIAGTIYKQLEEAKEAGKLYAKALKKFPAAGVLYAEYGELLWLQKDYTCISLLIKCGVSFMVKYS